MIPGLPAGYAAAGAAYPDDVDRVASLNATCDLVDVGFVDESVLMIDAHWRAPHFDAALDAVLVLAPDGSLAASGECGWSPGSPSDSMMRVHPAHRGRGLGSSLIAWAEARAQLHVGSGARAAVWNSVDAVDAPAIDLLLARGYRQVRAFRHMERSLTDLEPGPPAPEGIAIRAAAVPEDLPALHACIVEAFAEHFGATEPSFDAWRAEWMDAPGADPGLFRLGWDGDRLAGAAMSTGSHGVGWVSEVGVRTGWRGRGIGAALLRDSFAALADRGFAEVRLNVDAGNETGATRLYERAGMRVRREWLLYEKELPAG